MRLEAGLTFRRAARFHCQAAWPDRLRLNGGVSDSRGVLLPRDDWRPAGVDELALLVETDRDMAERTLEAEGGAAPDAFVCALLAIPAPLRLRWWEVAEAGAASGGDMPGYDDFVGEVAELLRFKGLPMPPRCAASVVVSRPGQRSTRPAPDGQRVSGLRFGSVAECGDALGAPLAVVNLGDERSYVVLLNLDAAMLRERGVREDTLDDELLRAFVRRRPEYPLVRVQLEPGEGLWLPRRPPAFDGWTVGKSDLDAVLLLHRL